MSTVVREMIRTDVWLTDIFRVDTYSQTQLSSPVHDKLPDTVNDVNG